jgi:nicotinate-nucleotide pyrophosphorylase (carboxylating)
MMPEISIHVPSDLTTRPDQLRGYLTEDIGFGDISSYVLPEGKEGKAEIFTKEVCTIAGIEEAAAIFGMLAIPVKQCVSDGEVIEKGKRVLEVHGDLRSMLAGERTALNILSRMSGIATLTRDLVTKARSVNPTVRIACSRKTTPGFRFFEKKAVILGGGDPHRFRLDDCIMLKDNHLKASGSIATIVARAREFSFSKKVEIEVETLKQAREAVAAGADIIMLDNMTPDSAMEGYRFIKDLDPRTIVEISGGITPDNILSYAGYADVISLGYLTHSYRSIDLSMEMLS